ncbi:hypothetical protein HKD42_04645 [Altererythrobacter sp. RZ02]|uniref:Uncharacterized protein n=1 Tax=Pontixanthobacter rizhaonensis TaxID=2730337 RepID=A0A848QKS0_9SPHN|nr:hypothetical protein [Pontixanthobacter rizhaonensis]NMW31340.1 hypothetical protein [Pontixanthobacter rizhaonensis]
MSDKFDRQLREDKVLRDSALAVVKADIEQVKQDHSAKNIGKRFANRMTEGAHDVLEQASAKASDQRGILVVLVAAIALWFARNPIMSLFNDGEDTAVNADGSETKPSTAREIDGSSDEANHVEIPE